MTSSKPTPSVVDTGNEFEGVPHLLSLDSLEVSEGGHSAYRSSYEEKTRHLLSTEPVETAMSLAIGGEYDGIGRLESALLRSLGLTDGSFLIDVGCGSGRLAVQLNDLQCKYLGIDIVPELLRYAQSTSRRPDWRFIEADGFKIPEKDEAADFVCFFSVITHLTHADSFRYLREAARVLRIGGKIVISFLEFKIPAHWDVFEQMVGEGVDHHVLNQFISRDALSAWAHHLNLQVVGMFDGDTPHIPISEDIRLDNGTIMKGLGFLGQSVCILTKPSKTEMNVFRGSPVANAGQREVSIQIVVRDAMRGRDAHIYVAAKEPAMDTLYNATPSGFIAAGLGSLEPFLSVTLTEHTFSLPIDIPGLEPGCALEVYAGYGTSPDDMVQNGDYAHLYTFVQGEA